MTRETENNPSLSFEKPRFQYCKELFERESQRKENLEKKAQSILSLATLLLGAIFFKLDFFMEIKKLLTEYNVSPFLVFLIYSSLLVLASVLWMMLFSLMKSMRLQVYKEEPPRLLISSVFSPDSDYMGKDGESSFFRATAMSYAIALEQNSEINDKKAVWVRYSWYCMIAAGASLGIFLFLYAYISLMEGDSH
jgi:hypothetical protein